MDFEVHEPLDKDDKSPSNRRRKPQTNSPEIMEELLKKGNTSFLNFVKSLVCVSV